MPAGSKSMSRGNGKRKPTLNSIYASYGGFHHFLHSFGLKPYNADEVEEGKMIAKAMLKDELEDWKESMNA